VHLLREAARRAGVRAIIHVPPGSHVATGREGDVLTIGRVSHAALFPRCAVLVHHGGAGTTHTALRAGVPSIVVPHVADQFFWANELARVGVALKSVPRRSITAAKLAVRITQTLAQSGLRQRAQILGARVRAENGPERAADLIETLWNES
jgi:UDP:flavonoid glycosyltransferase YjiC (YdhE family)